jgi:mono/diheme cytochrome c family protein
MRALLLVPALVALCACKADLRVQPRYDPLGEGTLFRDGKVMQAPPDGTLAAEQAASEDARTTRPLLDAALLARGKERFRIYCSPCHGLAGDGKGIIPARGFPQPPNFAEERLKRAPTRHIVDVISNGYGVMYSYAARVSTADRWAIAAYVRALQLSAGVSLDELSTQDRERLSPDSTPTKAPAEGDHAG